MCEKGLSQERVRAMAFLVFENRVRLLEQVKMKKNKTWLKGFLQGVTGSILVMGGLFYLQYGTLPLAGNSVVTGSSAHKAARI